MNYEIIKKISSNYFMYVLVITVLFSSSIASFYIGSWYSRSKNDEKEYYNIKIVELEQQMLGQNETIIGLNNELIELNKQLSNYSQLEGNYNTLKNDYYSLLSEYDTFCKDYDKQFGELETIKKRLYGNDNKILAIVANMSFALPQNYVFYAGGLYESTATMESGILTASTIDDQTLISFSWNTLGSEPNLTASLDNAFNSIGLLLEYEMYLTLEIANKTIIYSNFKTIVDNEYIFMNVSTWFEETDGKHYICIIQNNKNDVTDTLKMFVSGFLNSS